VSPSLPRVWIRGLAVLLAVGLTLTARAQTPERIVAIGDIHGASTVFRALLQVADLTDDSGAWTGGTTTLVQTGDFTDRGAGVRQVMELLMRLEREAPAAGGEVRVLLGNHEMMNLMADVRDATPDIYGAFATDDSPARRGAAYLTYGGWAAQRETELGYPLPDLRTREEWLAAHPPGFVEYMEAFGPEGEYGEWLRQRPIATRVGDTLFLHGGLSPDGAAASADALNEQARSELAQFDEYREHLINRGLILPFSTFSELLSATALELNVWATRLAPDPADPGRRVRVSNEDRRLIDVLLGVQGLGEWSVIDPDGPLWYRGFARWSDTEGEAQLPAVLQRFDVARVVVGHSVTPDRRVAARFAGRVFLIDTGMLIPTYQGRGSALELVGPEVTAVYLDGREMLAAPTP
jgi:hypothetical protein